MINKYAGKCVFCGQVVNKGYGRVDKVNGRWETSHNECYKGDVRLTPYRGRCEDAPCCGCCD